MNQERTFDELRGKLINAGNAQQIRNSYSDLTVKEKRRLEVILRAAVIKGGEIK